MTVKEQIHAEIDKVSDERLDDLYRLVKGFVAKTPRRKAGIMSKLKQIKIKAPEDFAANLDLYASGEKRVEENLH